MSVDTLAVPISTCAAGAAACWILALVTTEYSWVDRLWSILPVVYVGWFAWAAGANDARLNLMALLVATWGARLTFDFARKGGYAPGGEDYRWAELRQRISPALFQVFNLIFVCVIQNALLLAIVLPAWVALRPAGRPLGLLDAVAAALVALFIAGETIADEQQWRFQSDKRTRLARGEAVEPGFVTTGPLPLLAPSELLLRAGDLVVALPVRRGRERSLDHRRADRAARADRALPGIDQHHRTVVGARVPGVCRLPAADVAVDSVVARELLRPWVSALRGPCDLARPTLRSGRPA